MMRKFCLSILIMFVAFQEASAQELLVRHDRYYTELFLKLDLRTVNAVDKKNGAVVIHFSKSIKQPFQKQFKDRFIKSVTASGNTFTVNLYPDADVSVVNDAEGIKIVTSAKKTNSDIFSSYGIGNPLLTSENSPEEDKVQKDILDKVDTFITEKKFIEAAKLLNELLQTSKNDFYRQEALYRLGQTYLILSQVNDVYLADAYNTFDEFARLYPDNFRSFDALLKSSEAKEKANQISDAIASYQKIYDSAPDLEMKRRSLSKIGALYRTVGQYEKAIAAYQIYLDNFRTDSEGVLGEMGQVYYDLKDVSSAYEYFSLLDIDKLVQDNNTSSKRLFSIAKTMEDKKKFDNALKLYKALYEKNPEAKEANESIFKSAEILRNTNRGNEADMLLLTLKTQYPDKQMGQKASIEYAKKYLNTKPSAYWKEFFKDMLARDDSFGLHADAKYLIIKAMSAENNGDATIKAIEAFNAAYSGSKHFKELYEIRGDILFKNGVELFAKKDYVPAENILTKFGSEYPSSANKPRAEAILADIGFGKAMDLYVGGQFKDAAAEAEQFIAKSTTPEGTGRWLELLDNSSYKYLNNAYGLGDYALARANAKQYMNSFPNGKNVLKVREVLENSIQIPMEKDYGTGNYGSVTNIYETNSDWIKKMNNKDTVNELVSITGLSVYRLGAKDNAKKLYDSIPANGNSNYAVLGSLIGNKVANIDVDNLSGEAFTFLVSEVKRTDPTYALELVKKYTKDPKLAAKEEYDLAKSATGEVARQEILADIYEKIKGNPNARFDGSVDVYLDMGALYFGKNDFKNAIPPLKQFIDEYKTTDDKRAEALYYMGKAFAGLDDNERGFQYYNEIINMIPDSIYAGIAKSEMEQNAWKQSLKR